MKTTHKSKKVLDETKFHNIQARVDSKTNFEAEEVLDKSKSQVVIALFKQIALKKRIPFELTLTTVDNTELTQEEFMKYQSYLISQMDIGDEIPTWDETKLKPVNLRKK
jgi:antitoxin component of RelBE/YafQ-DinJ toxin-antitoxin module